MLPLQPDRSARAHALDGYGKASLLVTTNSPAAQALFAQGMAQSYAFNEVEAVRAFKAALAQDPDCAMCAWGVAYQLGPNINNPGRGDLIESLALRYADATRVNQQAIQLDLDFAKDVKAQGFDVSKDWRGHNGRFQWYGALMEGRGDLALEMARTAATRAAKGDGEWVEFMRSQPLMTLVRLEPRWPSPTSASTRPWPSRPSVPI